MKVYKILRKRAKKTYTRLGSTNFRKLSFGIHLFCTIRQVIYIIKAAE